MSQISMLLTCDTILKELAAEFNYNVYMNEAPQVESCLVYVYEPLYSNGTLNEIYLEVRIILEDESKILEVEPKLMERFLGIGDTQVIPNATYVEQSTGGSTRDYTNRLTHFFYGFYIYF